MSVKFASTVGVNFSNTFQKTPISATTAASQIAGIGAGVVKMFNYTQTDFIKAAKAQGLQVILDVPNDGLSDLSKNITSAVVDVVKQYPDTIIMVCVGNEPLGSWWNNAYNDLLTSAIQNLNTALIAAEVPTPLTVPFNFAIMGASYPPSAGALNSSYTKIVTDVCKVIKSSGGVFMINIYPFLDINSNPKDIKLPYCLFTATSAHWIQDGSYTYKNIFDASYDALHVALTAIGYGDLSIAVGECGWPTGPEADYVTATLANATTFNQNLITHCKSGKGTPRVPNIDINCFIFEMYDEDKKSTDPGKFETHWGVNDASGKAKYTLSL
jgi:exo-beta-1,3-glucanase (GH17 family)